MRKLLIESGQPGARVNKSDFEIELPNGSVFLFNGLDDPEKIKSIDGITDIVVEEATELTLDDFTQLNLRLRPMEPNPQIYMMFNPVSKANWVYSYFFQTKQPNTLIVNSTYKDNRFLTQDYRDTLESLSQTNPAYYRIYALGEFATLDKLVFPIIHKRLISPDEIRAFPQWIGLDFGYVNDPSAISWGRLDKQGRQLFITGEYSKKGMINPEIAEAIKSLGFAKEIIIADSAEEKSIEEIRRAGVPRIKPAVKGPDSIRWGIDTMSSFKIIVDERCIDTIEEFENYTWEKDKKTGEYINKPIDQFNHRLDAARYGIQSLVKKTGTRF
jgi:phage terminase large subunit